MPIQLPRPMAAIRAGSKEKNANVLVIGDSIAGRLITYAQTELSTALLRYFKTININDVTIPGIGSVKSIADTIPPSGLNYLYDDESDIFSSAYLNEETANSVTPGNYNAGILIIGTNDAHPALESSFSASSYKIAYAELTDAILARYTNMEKLLCVPVLRHYIGSADRNKQYQEMRTQVAEVVEENPKLVLGPALYDVDLTDQVHPTETAFQNIIAPRIGRLLGAGFSRRTFAGTRGPAIEKATWDGFSVNANITYNAETEIDVPAGVGDIFRIESDGVFLTPENVTKMDTEHITLDMSNTSLKSSPPYTLYSVYGQCAGLSQTSAAVISQTISTALPLRNSVITIENQDIISQLTNLALHGRAKIAAKTFASEDVTDFTDCMQQNYAISSGREPEYDETAFGGAGALVSQNTTTSVRSAQFTASSSLMVGVVVEFPASFAGNTYIFSLGNSSGGRFDAALIANAAGGLVYSDDEAGGDALLDVDCRSQKAIIIMNYKDTGELDIYYNAETPITLNPDDVYSTREYLWLFALNDSGTTEAGIKIGDWFVKTSAHDSENDPPIPDILAYWNEKYNVGLS